MENGQVNGTATGIPPAVQKMWALIQTGSISNGAEVAAYKMPDGTSAPAILFTHEDEHKVRKAKARFQRKLDRALTFNGAPANLGTAILGVVPMEVLAPKKREPKAKSAATNGTSGSAHKPVAAAATGKKS